MLRIVTVFMLVASFASIAHGQVVYNAYGPDLGFQEFQVTATQFVDIPGTEITIAVPTGKASINWSLTGRSINANGGGGIIRPVIGSNSPTNGVEFFPDYPNFKQFSGNWVTPVSGGSLTVKLQGVASSPSLGFTVRNFTWTVTAFPTTNNGVPAVSTWGLMILGLLILTVGTIAVSRRRQVA